MSYIDHPEEDRISDEAIDQWISDNLWRFAFVLYPRHGDYRIIMYEVHTGDIMDEYETASMDTADSWIKRQIERQARKEIGERLASSYGD